MTDPTTAGDSDVIRLSGLHLVGIVGVQRAQVIGPEQHVGPHRHAAHVRGEIAEVGRVGGQRQGGHGHIVGQSMTRPCRPRGDREPRATPA